MGGRRMVETNNSNPPLAHRLPVGLLVLRLILGLFLLQWTVEKFVLPQTTTGIFGKYFGIALAAHMPQILGGLELVLVAAFLAGAYRRVTYGLALAFTVISVGATWQKLIDPYGLVSGSVNHLFSAGVPLVAAFWLLYWLRDADVIWSHDGRRTASLPGNKGNAT